MERVYKRFIPAGKGGGPPDTDIMRAARNNIRYHLIYIGWLIRRRDWLAGDKPDLCRSGRGGAFVRRRLSGRCAVGRRRDRQGLVREDQIATLVPRAAGRDDARSAAVAELRQSRLLTADAAALKAALAEAARAQGFDAVGLARPDAIPRAAERLRDIPRSRRPWRHGLDGEKRRPARRSARVVGGRAHDRHARRQLRPG